MLSAPKVKVTEKAPGWRAYLECGHVHFYYVVRKSLYCLTCKDEVTALSAVNVSVPTP